MKKLVIFTLAMLLTGCVAVVPEHRHYAEPVYVAPVPVYVPTYHPAPWYYHGPYHR